MTGPERQPAYSMHDAEHKNGNPQATTYDLLVDSIATAPNVDALDELWTTARTSFAGRQLEELEHLIDVRARQIIDPADDPDAEPPLHQPRP